MDEFIVKLVNFKFYKKKNKALLGYLNIKKKNSN